MLALTGVSHKTAPLEIRERLALNQQEILECLAEIRPGTPCVVLSTCNRTEIYVSGADAAEQATAIAIEIAHRRGLTIDADSPAFYRRTAAGAVGHLYRVAAGLESMVIGEEQILGQVRAALHLARRAGTADGLLARLFETAVRVGRGLRATAGTNSPASVSAAAVDLALKDIHDLAKRSVVVVSTGDAGILAARNLIARGVRRLTLAGRTRARANAVAEELGVASASLHNLPEVLRDADVVLSATGARGYLIDRATIESAMQTRRERRMVLIDLAVPRDIDPAASLVQNVVLHDIDSLGLALPRANADGRDCRGVSPQLERAVEEFMQWWRERAIVPTISALRAEAERIRAGELNKTLSHLPALEVEDRRRLDALTSAIVNKLLHQPILALKESNGSDDYLETVRELFGLRVAAE